MSIESPEEALRTKIADALDRVMAEPRKVTLACAAAPPPQRLADEPAQPKQAPQTPNAERAHDEAVATRPARQVRNARIPVTILVAVIIAVVMMWPITNLFRSYVERPTPTIPAFDPGGSSEAPARTAAGDGLAPLPDPNGGSLRGPLPLPLRH